MCNNNYKIEILENVKYRKNKMFKHYSIIVKILLSRVAVTFETLFIISTKTVVRRCSSSYLLCKTVFNIHFTLS